MHAWGPLCYSPHEACLNNLFSSLSPCLSRCRRVSHRGQQTSWAEEAQAWDRYLHSPLPTHRRHHDFITPKLRLHLRIPPVWPRHPFPNMQSWYLNSTLCGLSSNKNCLPHLFFVCVTPLIVGCFYLIVCSYLWVLDSALCLCAISRCLQLPSMSGILLWSWAQGLA